MSTDVQLYYYVTEGNGDSSEDIEVTVTINGELEKKYLEAVRMHRNLEACLDAYDVLGDEYFNIKEDEIGYMISAGDEFVIECTGMRELDEDYISELVQEGEKKAITFFGLESLTEDELLEWNIREHPDELEKFKREKRYYKDYKDDFEYTSPFDLGYSMGVRFAEHPESEPVSKEEAEDTIQWIIKQKNSEELLAEYIKNISFVAEDFDPHALINKTV